MNNYITKVQIQKSIAKIEQSIQSGDLQAVMDAVRSSNYLDEPNDLLIQLLKGGYLDAAIYLYENKTSHCSTYEMQWSWDSSEFTKAATKLLYDALIEAERMDEAWNYHPLRYESPTYGGNASEYFGYVSDVVNHYCKKKNKVAAREFVKEHLVWFINNVDNDVNCAKDHPEFKSNKVNQRLMQQINNY